MSRRARVCPSGLRPRLRPHDNPADFPRLIPWESLDLLPTTGAGIAACSADGSPIRIRGRRLHLTLPDTRSSALAHKAQARALRRAWNAGTLSVAVTIARTPVWPLFVPLAACALLVALITPMLVAAWRQLPTFPPRLAPLAVAGILGFGAGQLLPAALVVRIVVALLRMNVDRISMDSGGITVWLADGRWEARLWRSLRSSTSGIAGRKLVFDDGLELRFRCAGRIPLVLGLWSAGLDPASRPHGPMAVRRQLRRIWALFLLGGLTAAAMVAYLQRQGLLATPGPTPLTAFLFIGVALPALVAAQALIADCLSARTKPLLRRRPRRAARRPPTPGSPPPAPPSPAPPARTPPPRSRTAPR